MPKISSRASAFGHASLQGKKVLTTQSSGPLPKGIFDKVVTAAGEKPEDIQNCFTKTAKYSRIFMEMGYRVRLGDLVTLFSTAQGVLNEDGTPVLGKEPVMVPHAMFDRSVTELLRAVSVNVTAGEPVAPFISDFCDAGTQSWNGSLTPGGIALVKGKHLKFHPTKADEGLFLAPVDGGDVVKVATFNKIDNGALGFAIPADLVSGAAYVLRISARIRNQKTLRTADSGFILTAV